MKILDSKLKHLIYLCKQTQNYKKLAVVGFVLLSNTIDEIGANLGVRARRKKENEHLHKYLEFINEIYHSFIKSPVFLISLIERLKITELIFLKLQGELPYDHIRELFTLYYELQEIEIPNIHNILGRNFNHEHNDLNFFMTMASKDRKHESSRAKELLLHNIRKKEVKLQKSLQQGFDKNCFEEALYLKQLKTSITRSKKMERIQDSTMYRMSEFSSLKYIIIGVMMLFVLLGSVVIYEMIIFPYITMAVSLYVLLFFGSSILLFILYRKQIH